MAEAQRDGRRKSKTDKGGEGKEYILRPVRSGNGHRFGGNSRRWANTLPQVMASIASKEMRVAAEKGGPDTR